MTEKANLAAKPILMFQQIFNSMLKNPRPTRAEASEVSNSVLDGVDGFILDTETADGDFPVNAVQSLVKCCLEAEKTIDWRKTFNDIKMYSPGPYGSAESVACASVSAVLDLKVDLIIVATETGKLARMVAKYKPRVPIICVSQNGSVIQSQLIQRGVYGVLVGETVEIEEQMVMALLEAKKMKVVETHAKIVTITASNEDSPDETNVMKIM